MSIIVRVPAAPESIYRSIQSQVGWFKKKTNLLEWNIKRGDWVEEGQVIARYNVKNTFTLRGELYKAEILAPFAGEILTIQNKDYTDWKKSDGKVKSGNDFSSHDILFVIKPSKDLEDEIYQGYTAERAIYKTYERLRIFTETAKSPTDGGITVGIRAKVETINS